MLHSLKIIWTLVSLNILPNSLLSTWMFGTEPKASSVVSWVEAWSICGLLFVFLGTSLGNCSFIEPCLGSPSP